MRGKQAGRLFGAGRLVAVGMVLAASLVGCAPDSRTFGPASSYNTLPLPAKYAGTGTIEKQFIDKSCVESGHATLTIDATGALELTIALPGTPIVDLTGNCTTDDGGAYAGMAEAKGVLTDRQFDITACNQGLIGAVGFGDFTDATHVHIVTACDDRTDGTTILKLNATLTLVP